MKRLLLVASFALPLAANAAIEKDPSASLPATGYAWHIPVNGTFQSSEFSTSANARLFAAISVNSDKSDNHTLSGAGLTWTLVGKQQNSSSQGVYLYTAVAITPILSQRITVSFTSTPAPNYRASASLVVHALSGTAAALGQVRHKAMGYNTGYAATIAGDTTYGNSTVVTAFHVAGAMGVQFATPDSELLGQKYANQYILAGLFNSGPYASPGARTITKYVWHSSADYHMGVAVEVLPYCAIGTVCDDFNPCTFGDTCDSQGRCVGTAISCASDTCVGRTCNGTSLCSETHAAAGVACDDRNSCTYADSCDGAGRCAGAAVSCMARLPCEEVQCNGTAWCAVVPAAVGTLCSSSQYTCARVCDGVSPNCQPAE